MSKSLMVLIGLLVLLLVVYLLVSSGEKRELTPEVKSDFLGIDSAQVNRIEVHKLGSQMEFKEQPDGWYVIDGGKSRLGQQQAIQAVLHLAHTLAVGEIISSNPDKQMLFQVDTLTGTTVQFYHDDQLLGGLIVGKMGSDYQSTYVRKPESNDVYAALGAFTQLFTRPPSSYMDKTLLAISPDSISMIEYRGNGTNYALMSQDSVWQVVPQKGQPFDGDKTKVQQAVNRFANLQFSEFLKAPDSVHVDWGKPDLAIKLTLDDGSEHVLSFIKQKGENKNYYVLKDSETEPYIIFGYIVDSIAPKQDNLKPSSS